MKGSCCANNRFFTGSCKTNTNAPSASSGWGCGAWHGRHWFQLRWDERSAGLQIMIKELLPVVLACAVWGPLWAHTRVVCLCDNQAVVACLHSRTTRDSHCMHMLWTLAFVEARHAFSLCPGKARVRQNCVIWRHCGSQANHVISSRATQSLVV